MKDLFKGEVKTIYSHKNGSIYTAIGIVKFQMGSSNEREIPYVLYVNSEGKKFIREMSEFHDGRFSRVKEDNTEYSIAEIGSVLAWEGASRFYDPPVIRYTGLDVIDATNIALGRKVCLAWKDRGPVFVMSEGTLVSLISKNLLLHEKESDSEKSIPNVQCPCHKLGEYYYTGGLESIMPLCSISHENNPNELMKDDVKLYKFCPNCGKELLVMRTTVRNAGRFMSVFWDENLTEG